MWDAKASCQDKDQGSDGLYCSGTSGAGTSYRSTILVDRGLKDILDHNLKETFYVNVVALTTWVMIVVQIFQIQRTFMNHTTFASKIFNLQKIRISFGKLRVFVFSFLHKSKIFSLYCFESERKIDPS